jgi:hypothetical protein
MKLGFLLQPWPVQQPPLLRPLEDSTACICGPIRNDRARCVPAVYLSEQPWNECTAPVAILVARPSRFGDENHEGWIYYAPREWLTVDPR